MSNLQAEIFAAYDISNPLSPEGIDATIKSVLNTHPTAEFYNERLDKQMSRRFNIGITVRALF